MVLLLLLPQRLLCRIILILIIVINRSMILMMMTTTQNRFLSLKSLFSLSLLGHQQPPNATPLNIYIHINIYMYVHESKFGRHSPNSIPTKYALLTTVALVRAVLPVLCSDRFYIYIWAFSVFLLERFDGWMLITAS